MNDQASLDEDGGQIPKCRATTRPIAVTPEDEREFFTAMQAYKQQSGRLFPTWSEILEVLRSLGYAKRIWKPVGAWSPIAGGPTSGEGRVGDPTEVLGWFSRVETPMGT